MRQIGLELEQDEARARQLVALRDLLSQKPRVDRALVDIEEGHVIEERLVKEDDELD